MKLDHPMTLAAEIARLIESDPVAAAQVKEYLSEDRLGELLGLQFEEPEVTEEREAEMLELCSDMAVLEYVAQKYTKARVLSYFK